MTTWFEEVDTGGFTLKLAVDRFVCRQRTEFQDLAIFDSPLFGRALALDGVVQTTEKDEAAYHEMIVQVPVLAHGRVRRALVIGGGDGGALRELLKHPEIEKVTLVELDRQVVELCREHLPALSAGAFDDPRAEILFDDGIAYAARCRDRFDLIIVDSTDPLPGPGEVLFSDAFYADCKRLLGEGGLLITQFGMPYVYPKPIRASIRRLKGHFADVALYAVAVPVFAGGYMVFGWASDRADLRRVTGRTLAERYAASDLATRFYTVEFHQACFALPRPIAALLE